MSVLMEFSIFPTDKGISVSEDVSKVIAMLRSSGYNFELTAMGSIVETNTLDEALQLLKKSHQILDSNSERIYMNCKFDIKKGDMGRMKQKIKSIENKIGSINPENNG